MYQYDSIPKILHSYTRDIYAQFHAEERRPAKEEHNYLGIIDINYYRIAKPIWHQCHLLCRSKGVVTRFFVRGQQGAL